MQDVDALRRRFLRPRKRGEPLVIFLLVLVIWTGGRGLVWRDLAMKARSAAVSPVARAAVHQQNWRVPDALPSRRLASMRLARDVPLPHPAAASSNSWIPPVMPLELPQKDMMSDIADTAKVQSGAARQMLYLAVMGDLPLPIDSENQPRAYLSGQRDAGSRSEVIPVLAVKHGGGELARPRLSGSGPRWSGDGWLLMRQGGNSHALAGSSAPYGPTYGANQVGAVLRYRLMPGEAHKFSAYTRGYAALNGTGEREAAAGLSLRPFVQAPVIAMAEMRASQFQSGQMHARPALSLVSDVNPISLGGKLEADTYVQAGYVGGAASTPFIDGQLRVEQVLNAPGHAQWRMGVGAWGGAQQGVNRLDVGPTLRLGMTEGRVGARLAIDYRLRVQGNAMPTSGPSVTLSAGF